MGKHWKRDTPWHLFGRNNRDENMLDGVLEASFFSMGNIGRKKSSMAVLGRYRFLMRSLRWQKED
jgi:hypothetical protein